MAKRLLERRIDLVLIFKVERKTEFLKPKTKQG